jgi:hypothetical protein
MPQDETIFPQQQPTSGNGDVNETLFAIQRTLALMNIATQVKVVAVHTSGNTSPVGTVDVMPIVNVIDGSGRSWPHDTIYDVPYIRIQGGINAVICDPHAGDIGLCVFCDRDQSAAQKTGAQSNPGSGRRFDLADGIYIGGWNSQVVPQNYVVINPDGSIAVLSTGRIDVTGTTCEFHCPVVMDQTLQVVGNTTLEENLTVLDNVTLGGSLSATGSTGSGNATLAGSLTATGNVKGGTVDLETHVHTNVQSGSSNTGGPVG